jgi:hypothetical protein
MQRDIEELMASANTTTLNKAAQRAAEKIIDEATQKASKSDELAFTCVKKTTIFVAFVLTLTSLSASGNRLRMHVLRDGKTSMSMSCH